MCYLIVAAAFGAAAAAPAAAAAAAAAPSAVTRAKKNADPAAEPAVTDNVSAPAAVGARKVAVATNDLGVGELSEAQATVVAESAADALLGEEMCAVFAIDPVADAAHAPVKLILLVVAHVDKTNASSPLLA